MSACDMGHCEWQLDIANATIDHLEDIIRNAVHYLEAPDAGYGLTPIGVVNVLNILRGEPVEGELA